MELDEYNLDAHDGAPCARPGCPGRATGQSPTGVTRICCSVLCANLVREYERNSDWLSYARNKGQDNAVRYATAQREILDRVSEVVSEYRNTRRPAEHQRYVRYLKQCETVCRSEDEGLAEDK